MSCDLRGLMTHVQLDNCDILIMVVEQLVLKDVLYTFMYLYKTYGSTIIHTE